MARVIFITDLPKLRFYPKRVQFVRSADGVKYQVIEALGDLRDKHAVGILLDLFKDDKSEKIVSALGNIGDKCAIEPLIERFLKIMPA